MTLISSFLTLPSLELPKIRRRGPLQQRGCACPDLDCKNMNQDTMLDVGAFYFCTSCCLSLFLLVRVPRNSSFGISYSKCVDALHSVIPLVRYILYVYGILFECGVWSIQPYSVSRCSKVSRQIAIFIKAILFIGHHSFLFSSRFMCC